MKAIPTIYNGVQYRSMLEARYAAFFELVSKSSLAGWHTHSQAVVQYEPEAFDGYIPDFIITRDDNGCGRCHTVVEIKGTFESFDLAKIRASGWEGDVICADSRGPNFAFSTNEYPRTGAEAWDFGLFDLRGCPCDKCHDGHCADGPCDVLPKIVDRLWKRAGNAVQWRSPAQRAVP